MADLFTLKGYDRLYPNAIPSAFRFEGIDIRIEWRGAPLGGDQDRWAIVSGGAVYARDGEWEYEPLPSNRDEEFFSRCRFTLAEAMDIVAEPIFSKGRR